MMKFLLATGSLLLLLAGCTDESKQAELISSNSVGSYQKLYINQFAQTINTGSNRYSTGNVFVRHQFSKQERAIELYPGMMYEPEVPDSMQKGYTAEILLEQVNRSGEQPREIHSKTISNWDEAKVKMPNEKGKMYRYTIKVKDAEGTLKDTRYDPLFTTFDDYNMAMNISKSTYKVGEGITILLENWGPNHLAYHKYGKLFKKDGESWKEIKMEDIEGWEGPAIIPSPWLMDHLKINEHSELLDPGSFTSILLSFFKIDKGEYRFVMEAGSKKHVYELEDYFVVE
ncbi:MAG: hypothetical protein ACE3JQ_03635 [Paenisporosarcina sp.]